jgi:hypothetical protein
MVEFGKKWIQIMSEASGFPVQQGALDVVARSLASLLSSGDERIVYSSRGMGSYGEGEVWAVRQDGEHRSPFGRANSLKGPDGDGFTLAKIRLRKACYQEGKGTWFGLEVTVAPDGAVTANYNYDTEPEWRRPIEPTLYVQEQERYPRDPEYQPEWFRQRLAEGQMALDEWRQARGK